jgi:hypothetical protein
MPQPKQAHSEGVTCMSGITHIVDSGKDWHPAISVKANLRSRLCRSQNRRIQKGLPV